MSSSKVYSLRSIGSLLVIGFLIGTAPAFAKDPVPTTRGEELKMEREAINKDLSRLYDDRAFLEHQNGQWGRGSAEYKTYSDRYKALSDELILNSRLYDQTRKAGGIDSPPNRASAIQRAPYTPLPGVNEAKAARDQAADQFAKDWVQVSKGTGRPGDPRNDVYEWVRRSSVEGQYPSQGSSVDSSKPDAGTTRLSQKDAALQAFKLLSTSTSSFSDEAVLDMFPEIKKEAKKLKLKAGTPEYEKFIANAATDKRTFMGKQFEALYRQLSNGGDESKKLLAEFAERNKAWLPKTEKAVLAWQLQHTSNGLHQENPEIRRISSKEAWAQVEEGSVNTKAQTKLLKTYFGSSTVVKSLVAFGIFGVGASMANASEGADLAGPTDKGTAKGFSYRNGAIPVTTGGTN